MGKIHILEQSRRKDSVRCIFHIGIPSENNAAGVNYRTALRQFLELSGEEIGSDVPDLASADPDEYNDIQAGAVFEEPATVQFSANLTNAQKAALIDQRYQDLEAEILSQVQDRLRFWGMVRNPA